MLQFFADNSALSLGVFYFIYNTISPYILDILSFFKPIVFRHILALFDYKEEGYNITTNTTIVMEILDKHINTKFSYINNDQLSFDVKQARELLYENCIDSGNHILYLNGYGYVYFKYAGSDTKSKFTFYLIAPAKLIQHIKSQLTNMEFVKCIDNGTCYRIFNVKDDKFLSKKPLLMQTKLQSKIINKIKKYARNIFPVLHKNNLPTVYSILLHGPPGTGKTTICNTIVSELSASIIYFNINELDKIYTLIEKQCCNKNSIKIIAINELDLYYKKDTKLSTGQSSGFIDNIHDILENSGSYSSNNFTIIICTTNNYAHIAEKDPATISRFRDIVEMPNLTSEEAKEFAKDYAKVVLESQAYLLDDKIDKFASSSIREITKFVTSEATHIIANNEIGRHDSIPESPHTDVLKKTI